MNDLPGDLSAAATHEFAPGISVAKTEIRKSTTHGMSAKSSKLQSPPPPKEKRKKRDRKKKRRHSRFSSRP